MAASKTTTSFLASTSNAAGATTNGSWIDLTASYGGVLFARITNGGTGPTIACGVRVDRADDSSGTNARPATVTLAHSTTANAVGDFQIGLDPALRFARVVFTGNTGQAVTVEARADTLTGV
jgi:hypothetical protein